MVSRRLNSLDTGLPLTEHKDDVREVNQATFTLSVGSPRQILGLARQILVFEEGAAACEPRNVFISLPNTGIYFGDKGIGALPDQVVKRHDRAPAACEHPFTRPLVGSALKSLFPFLFPGK